jgi:hypothetical protein
MDSVNEALNVLQSIQLPFALLPVLYISTRKDVMGSTFVLQNSFRVTVHVICWLLLALNFAFIGIAIITWGMETSAGGLYVCGVAVTAVLYIAFVVYLFAGPSRIHYWFSQSDNPALQLLDRLFGRAEGLMEVPNGGVLTNGLRDSEAGLLQNSDLRTPRSSHAQAGNGVFRVGSLEVNDGGLVQAGSLPDGSFPDSSLPEL